MGAAKRLARKITETKKHHDKYGNIERLLIGNAKQLLYVHTKRTSVLSRSTRRDDAFTPCWKATSTQACRPMCYFTQPGHALTSIFACVSGFDDTAAWTRGLGNRTFHALPVRLWLK